MVSPVSSFTILIVEDDQAMAQMCAKLIRRRGYAAVIADSCVDALSIVRTPGDVDAVVSDVQMPQMSGFEFLSRVREFNADIPVILMTGYTNIVSSAEALALGATDYLAKPFSPATLICSLEKAFLHRPAV